MVTEVAYYHISKKLASLGQPDISKLAKPIKRTRRHAVCRGRLTGRKR